MKISIFLKFAVFAMAVAATSTAEARYWWGHKESKPVSGPSITDNDLLGRIVLVYCFDATNVNVKLLKRTQAIYEAYGRDKLAVVGSCRDESGIAALVKQNEITYPVYKDFRLVTCLEKKPGTLYFSNEYGRLIWQAYDAASLHDLGKALVKEIGRCGEPPSFTEGVAFQRHGGLKDKLVLGQPDIPSLVKSLPRDDETKQILSAIGRGREETVANIRVLMDYNGVAAFNFLDLYLKSFPEDKQKYAKLYDELEARAAREKK